MEDPKPVKKTDINSTTLELLNKATIDANVKIKTPY
jgi:hypothetical protein